MTVTTWVLIALLVVVSILYVQRRRSRLSREGRE